MKTMIKEHRALFVVCSWSFVLKMAFVDRKRGQDLKKIWCRTPIKNLKNSPSPEEFFVPGKNNETISKERRKEKPWH